LNLHDRDRFAKESLEVDDVLLELIEVRSILRLVNGEVLAVLLKDLHRALLEHALKDLLDVASLADENPEFS
jgi:hypothetical protein